MTFEQPPAVQFLAPGTRLGKYEIIRGVAVGGMAELYLARMACDDALDRVVALKRILPHYAAQEEFLHMFLDEARLTAKLQHPHIAQVFDIGSCPDGLFFTMEYIAGQDVRQMVRAARGRRVPLAHALSIAIRVAHGLHAAHELRDPNGELLCLVHRDISPSNILVSFDGHVKIIDFGVAKARGRLACTHSGIVKGKVSYMSPEQCRGDELDRRSDVFALGILLYEMSTGKRLYKGNNEFAVLERIVKRDVPLPSARVDDYPLGLEPIVMRALARDADDRYQSAKELADAVVGFAQASDLDVSQAALAGYMRSTCADAIEQWEHLLARLEGDRAVDELWTDLPRPSTRVERLTPVPPGQIVGLEVGQVVGSREAAAESADEADGQSPVAVDGVGRRQSMGAHSYTATRRAGWGQRGFAMATAAAVFGVLAIAFGGPLDTRTAEERVTTRATGAVHQTPAYGTDFKPMRAAALYLSSAGRTEAEERAKATENASAVEPASDKGESAPAKSEPTGRQKTAHKRRQRGKSTSGDKGSGEGSRKNTHKKPAPTWDPDAALPPAAE